MYYKDQAMTGKVYTFPGNTPVETEEQATLGEWFATIENRVGDEPIEHAIVVVISTSGEQVIYSLNDMRKDQFVGTLHIAAQQGLYDGVAP